VVVADRQVQLAESVAVAIRSHGGTAVAVELDVRTLASMTHVVEDTVARWGSVDFFFNNAGIGVGGDAADYTSEDWNDVIDVNLRGVIHGIQAVYPVMIRQQSGHIINTASIAGLVTTAGQTVYAATKHAVVALSKSLRIEAKCYGVRVSVLCPGAIRTPILHGGKFGRLKLNAAALAEVNKLVESLRPMPADVLAPKVAAAVARNQAFIVLPSWWRLLWLLERISPALSIKLVELGYTRFRQQTLVASELPAQPLATVRRPEPDRNLS
jgi:NAD(P)-dependent dehydrogenase (short-subunit alcohol dehydrogenase family)